MENRDKMMRFALILIPGLIVLAIVITNLMSVSAASHEILTQPSRVLLPGQSGVHKDLFPLDNSDISGSLMIGVGLMIAASGGIGGGGILVPLLIIVFGFKPKFAVPLSNFTILGASITNIVLNLPKRHPDADRPLIDWDLILVMEPLTMAGAVRILR
jgi:Sulfite exporter TauE/SafE